MKWTRDKLKYSKIHRRAIKKFLWIPLELDNTYKWLEFAYIVQTIDTYYPFYPFGERIQKRKWINARWCDKAEMDAINNITE